MGSLKAHGRVGHPSIGMLGCDKRLLRDRILTMVQVIHNELDYRLPISEGLAMFNVLQARGVPSKLVMFPDENHVSLLNFLTPRETRRN